MLASKYQYLQDRSVHIAAAKPTKTTAAKAAAETCRSDWPPLDAVVVDDEAEVEVELEPELPEVPVLEPELEPEPDLEPEPEPAPEVEVEVEVECEPELVPASESEPEVVDAEVEEEREPDPVLVAVTKPVLVDEPLVAVPVFMAVLISTDILANHKIVIAAYTYRLCDLPLCSGWQKPSLPLACGHHIDWRSWTQTCQHGRKLSSGRRGSSYH